MKQGSKREQTQVRLDARTKRLAKIEAAKRGVSMKALLCTALTWYLDQPRPS